ncbi:unnamed protein product [Bemisia tabaci]|uniref:Uncharacterized protein n=1 Tax=Bemisia tabaci TaxID=7038 RepID=A0A9P0AI62_BEMTA|nr:unnamed protein product [Bemisia tabaci]
MYAKLMFWAGPVDVMDHSGLATQAIALPQMANYIDYIQLDAGVPGPQTGNFLRAINNGHIMFTRDKDFASDQYDVLCWLAAPGYRVAAAANVRTPDFCYVKWPEVIVTILGYGANFAAPANAMISSARIREFARQLATARGEEADLCRGMYIAFDLLGTRYRTHEDVHYRLDSFLSPAKAPLWSRLAKSEILYREFILRNVDIAPFKEPWDSINLVSSSRLVAWGGSATPRATVVYGTSAAGETLFPNLSSLSRSKEVAQKYLPTVVSRILAYPVQSVAEAAFAEAKVIYPGIDAIEALETAVSQCSAVNAVKILVAASNAFNAVEPRYAESLFMHNVLALVKKGTISDDFVNKFKQGVAQFQLDITVDKALLKNIFDAFNKAVDANLVRGMAEYWLSICPPECLRVSLTIIQCQWEGLALYKAINDAMTTNPDFYWGSLFRIPQGSR